MTEVEITWSEGHIAFICPLCGIQHIADVEDGESTCPKGLVFTATIGLTILSKEEK